MRWKEMATTLQVRPKGRGTEIKLVGRGARVGVIQPTNLFFAKSAPQNRRETKPRENTPRQVIPPPPLQEEAAAAAPANLFARASILAFSAGSAAALAPPP